MHPQTSHEASLQLIVNGRVQGLGFRPFVYQLATSLSLAGTVQNTREGVRIDLLGSEEQLATFRKQLPLQAPPNCDIHSIECRDSSLPQEYSGFVIIDSIAESRSGTKGKIAEVSPDLPLCSNCLNELFTADNRRYLHPFISCTQCGPRFSIIAKQPYDRPNTSMAQFDMCHACQSEYQSPEDLRRFHSQINACDHCGPSLQLIDCSTQRSIEASSTQMIDICAEHLRNGEIIGLKGVGGFHLICDANNEEGIAKLRQFKRRPDKPFAIMALNSRSLEAAVQIDETATELLKSSSAPIVLITKNADESILAPNLDSLGAMLPYTPIHYLLFHALLGRPSGTTWLTQACNTKLLVTSANCAGEPIIFQNEKALHDLKSIASCILTHDRDILAPSDDSVVQSGHPSTIIRRARGLAPESLKMPDCTPDGLACGAHLKNTFCLTQHKRAYLSPYVGELHNPAFYERYQMLSQHFGQIFGQNMAQVSSDLHPDYVSTHFAEKLSSLKHIPLKRIQHHEAHFAAVMAEQEAPPPNKALGLVLDGYGLGYNQESWGGELLSLNNARIDRIGHLETLCIPGGDKATREIWRIGACLLSAVDKERALLQYDGQLSAPWIRDFILQGQHLATSSAGRWFDAIASLIGLRQISTYEGQAAAELESLASQVEGLEAHSLINANSENHLILSPLIPHLLGAKNMTLAARMFHCELVDGLGRWVEENAKRVGTRDIYCSGGCFQNRILRESLNQHLASLGFRVYFPTRVPANDGGISLGQAYLSHHNVLRDSSCV